MKERKTQKPSVLSEADLYSIYRRWRDGVGLFECYVKATCFVSLQHYPDFKLTSAAPRHDIAFRKIAGYVAAEMESNRKGESKTLFLLDLPAVKSLQAAQLLNHDYGLRPVLTMRQIYHPQGIVGSHAEISALLLCGLSLHEEAANGYVFILDSCRCAEYDKEIFADKFNNRYEISRYDLPTVEMLYDAGFTKLILMHTGALKRDVADYIGSMRIDGFNACTIRVEGHES